MPGNPHTSVRSRQVAAQLRELRERAELSCSEVAKTLGLSVSKVSRMETANSGMQVEDVAAMLGLYRVSSTKRQELIDLLRRSEEKGWWQRQAGLPQLWRTLIDFEAKATRIQNFENMFIPGLLQTAEYCRAILQSLDGTLSEAEVDHLVAARMARQAVLTRSRSPQFVAIIDENALRRRVGAEGVMHRQLLHLSALADRPNIVLRVVQRNIGAYVGMQGPFMILEFGEEPTLAYMENHGTEMFLEEDAELAAFQTSFVSILGVALNPADSAELVHDLVSEH